jgi:hypothetical protein
MADRLIITNGDSAVARMREAGLEADFLPWRDMLHAGPVPRAPSLEELSNIRARYLAEEFEPDPADVDRGFAERDAAIRNHAKYDRVELWFEHDLYDQLQLIQILDHFADGSRVIFLVQANDYLGLMPADAVRALEPAARALTAEEIEAATDAWAAFTAETPERLTAPAASDRSPLPFLPAALRRLLAELPAVRSGLSLTEERVLAALTAGPRKVGELFKITQAQEEARFLGDAPFFHGLDGLAFCATPLVTGLPFAARRCVQGPSDGDYRAFAGSMLSLTDAGRAALAGTFDHAPENGIDRWLGGTHLTRENLWRRDPRGGIVPPTEQ